MNFLTLGAMILLWLILVTGIAAGAETLTLELQGPTCDSYVIVNNQTVCNEVDAITFFQAYASVITSGFTGAPDTVNIVWVFFLIFFAALGIVLIFSHFFGIITGASG